MKDTPKNFESDIPNNEEHITESTKDHNMSASSTIYDTYVDSLNTSQKYLHHVESLMILPTELVTNNDVRNIKELCSEDFIPSQDPPKLMKENQDFQHIVVDELMHLDVPPLQFCKENQYRNKNLEKINDSNILDVMSDQHNVKSNPISSQSCSNNLTEVDSKISNFVKVPHNQNFTYESGHVTNVIQKQQVCASLLRHTQHDLCKTMRIDNEKNNTKVSTTIDPTYKETLHSIEDEHKPRLHYTCINNNMDYETIKEMYTSKELQHHPQIFAGCNRNREYCNKMHYIEAQNEMK